jgi:ribonuclease Z
MKLHTLGTGGPMPDPRRNASCYVLEAGEARLMFDVGRGAIVSLARKGLPFARINPLFISHHHVDHIGELADYLIASWLAGRREKLRIFGPPGTRAIVDALMGSVYARDIEFRTGGETAFGPFIPAEVVEVRAGPVYDDGEIKVSCAEMEHGHGLPFTPLFRQRWICLAWRVESGGRTFSFSGDAVMSDALVRLAAGSDLHLQCCYMAASELRNEHLKGVAKYTLACSDTAGKIAAQAGVKRLVLTHFKRMEPAQLEAIAQDVRRDYAGPVSLANDLDEIEF